MNGPETVRSAPLMPRIDWFEKWALYSPEAVALQDDASGRRYTYAQCRGAIDRIARMLANEFGVGPGDRVAVLSMNEPEYVFLLFACQKLGAILLPLNYRLAPRELAWMLGNAEAALLIHQRRFQETVEAMEGPGLPRRRLAFDGPDSYVTRLSDEGLPSDPVSVRGDFDTPCMILYTAGTTGHPKGALITNGMLFWNSINTTLRLNIVQSDVTLTFTPFFHTGGWNVLTTPFLHRGAKVILLPRFDPDRVLRLCEAEAVSLLFGLPTIMEMLRQSPEFQRVDLSSVRYAIVGGEPMSLELIRVWHERGVPIRQGFGLTEFGPNVFSLNEEHAERKIGSIGFPNFYVDAEVVDDQDRRLGPGEIGELALRGPVCTPGYWRNPEATAQAIREGWFHTGDLVKRDEEGFFYVVDRKKDMYKSGGENVYPVEVEHFLRTHPKVRDVAVVGVPDERWGEVGMAFVVLRPGESLTTQDLLDFCAGQIAKFKTPKYVEFIEELPVSDAGKVLKKALREQAVSALKGGR